MGRAVNESAFLEHYYRPMGKPGRGVHTRTSEVALSSPRIMASSPVIRVAAAAAFACCSAPWGSEAVRGERGRLLVACVDGTDAELDARRLGLQHRSAHNVEHRLDAL